MNEDKNEKNKTKEGNSTNMSEIKPQIPSKITFNINHLRTNVSPKAINKSFVNTIPRPLSTFKVNVEKEKDEEKICAAPFPSIPTVQEVKQAKDSVEEELTRLNTELSSLLYEKNRLNSLSRLFLSDVTSEDIHMYRGMVISDKVIHSILEENRKKAQESHHDVLIEPSPVPDTSTHMLPMYRHLADLSDYKTMLETHNELLVPLLVVRMVYRTSLIEKEKELVEKYHSLNDSWQNVKESLDEYNARTGEKNENWPDVFYFEPDGPNEIDDKLKWTAPDTRMFISKREKFEKLYFDNNGFVPDPVKEHKEYMNRSVWVDGEKRAFIEAFRNYNREFNKIAKDIPDKTVNEIIEYYYLNKYKLNLLDIENVSKRRSSKKKIVQEGSSRKNYGNIY